jgi:hypothetical protein
MAKPTRCGSSHYKLMFVELHAALGLLPGMSEPQC